MANVVYGGPSWLSTAWNKIKPPSPAWPAGVPYTNSQDRGTYDATQGQGDYRGGSKWPTPYPYGQAPTTTGSVWSSTPRGLPWIPGDNPLAAGSTPWRGQPAPATRQPAVVTAPSAMPSTTTGYAQVSANVPAGVQQVGLSNWYQRFVQQHGGQTPEDYYRSGSRREGLSEALADLDWSKGFQQMYGRPPSEDDWKAWYFQSRGGGNFGAHELWRKVKGMTKKEYERALAKAQSKEERRQIKEYWAAIQRQKDARRATEQPATEEPLYYAQPVIVGPNGEVVWAGAGPRRDLPPVNMEPSEEEPLYYGRPAPIGGEGPLGEEEPGMAQRQPLARPPLWLPPQVYWQLR